MSKYAIMLCAVLFVMAVSALFWGLDYFLDSGHESYVWDQYVEQAPDGATVQYEKGKTLNKIHRLLKPKE